MCGGVRRGAFRAESWYTIGNLPPQLCEAVLTQMMVGVFSKFSNFRHSHHGDWHG